MINYFKILEKLLFEDFKVRVSVLAKETQISEDRINEGESTIERERKRLLDLVSNFKINTQ